MNKFLITIARGISDACCLPRITLGNGHIHIPKVRPIDQTQERTNEPYLIMTGGNCAGSVPRFGSLLENAIYF